ncbi:hypothetical protein V1515DRAFT_640054 [Lipomyces mesembrius]
MVSIKSTLLVAISISGALASPIVKSIASTLAAASVSYALPSFLTPSDQHTFRDRVIRGFGKQEDPDYPLTIYRDGGGYSDGTFKAMTDNSLSVARSFDNPRYAMWTYTNCLQATNNRAVKFFNLRKYNSIWSASDLGNTMVTLDFDPDTEMLTVTRDQQVTFPPTTYAYSLFASMVVNGVDSTASILPIPTRWMSTSPELLSIASQITKILLSHCPLHDADQRWSSRIGCRTRRGSMFYSEYHNAYLLVFRVSYAPSPVGPFFYTLPSGPRRYDYGGVAHPQYYQYDGPSGKALLLHYSYQDTMYTYTKAAKLVFK